MAESLRRLTNISPFPQLQEKLELWLDTYHLNTKMQNVDRCSEALEMSGRLHTQLISQLRLIDPSADVYSSKYYLYPDLYPYKYYPYSRSTYYPHYPYSYPEYPTVLLREKNKEIATIQDTYEINLQNIEDDLNTTKIEADDLQAELETARSDLDDEKRKSTSDKMMDQSEISSLQNKLRIAEDEVNMLRAREGVVNDYERTIHNLRNDVDILTGRKDLLSVSKRIPYEPPAPLPRPYRPLYEVGAPLPSPSVTQQVRQPGLVARYNDMYSIDRLDAMQTLRRFCDDHENNERIVFTAMQEAFSAGKRAFQDFKMRVRGNLAGTHTGPETLEEAVQAYIDRNTDLYDLPNLVSDVVRALNLNPSITLPADVSYTIVQPFIREACKMAWSMCALPQPLDVNLACEAELYDDNKYRRTFDSEYTAPLVHHYIWPALKQGIKVITKGEACTLRGASLVPRSRSRSPSRSASSIRARSVSPSRRSLSPGPRSRSPSPRRLTPTSSLLSTKLSMARSSVSPSRASSRLS